MGIISGAVPGVSRLTRLQELSKKARQRLKWFDYYNCRGHNTRLTCRYFGISPQAFYRWKRRYNPRHIASLEDRSHQPRHLRQPTYFTELVERVLKLRETYPRWGKDKLVILLHREGFDCSASMIGRILHKLKERGVLKEPVSNHISMRKRRWQHSYAIRKPKEYLANKPGDIVEVDTLDVRLLPGIILKHFTVHDIVSRWDVVSVHSRANASTVAHFLDTVESRMPFPVRAIQVDGGAEFEAIFEEECQRRDIKLFVLPSRSPKLNGGVERAHRTHIEEFYEVTASSFDLSELRDELLEWEGVYNTIVFVHMISDTFPLFLDFLSTAFENWNESIFLTLNSEDNIIYLEKSKGGLTFYLLRGYLT